MATGDFVYSYGPVYYYPDARWQYSNTLPDPKIAELEKRITELERILAEHRLT